MSVDVTFTPDPDIIKRIEQASEAGIIAATLAVEAQAVGLCPVDTGRLRGSITWKTFTKDGNVKMKTGVGKGEGIVGTNVEYAPYVEFGTTRHPKPQSFLRRGLDVIRPKFEEIYGAAFKRVLG